ncbi:MAG: TonB-dependent receptor [Bacteroidetes bacterium]|nr:TonB-dependent receptor [Bacteroidota bacterium]
MTCAGFGQEAHPSGSIHGSVLDAETGQPLPGANVSIPDADDGIPNVSAGIPGTTRGAAADAQGRFSIPNLAPGTYRVRVTYIGYETRIITDVVVRPARGTEVAVRLHPAAVETGEVEITAGYFASVASGDVGIAEFSGEEIRRSPGSAGDVSRIMMVLPSVAKVNDQSNSLIVRGGSPLENAFFIDGMEIPNINHFPAQGSSGGPIGLLPVDLIRDVRFSAGGFPAEYGDRLSSVMDIALREGSRDRVAAQLDLNFAGFGGLAEGPIASSGSWLVSARRSYLDLIVKAVDAGTSVAPWYGDAAAKVVVDVSPAHRLSAVALWSDDHNDPDLEAAVENDMQYYGRQDIVNATAGIAWRALWSGNVFSNTTFSFTGMRFREHFRLTANGLPVLDNDSGERWLQLRHATHLRVSPLLDVEIGGDLKRLFNRYDNRYGAVPDALGNPVPAAAFVADADNTLTGLFATASLSSWSRLTLTAGFRAQHSTWNDRIELQPRASAALALTELTTVTLSGGVYTQSLPLLLLAQDAASPALPDPRALQGVLGIAHLLTASTRLTLEGYVKQYDRFPIDPSQPELFVVDELSYRYGFFTPHARLTASGKAFSRGLELTLQKKLAQDVYGLASVAWSTARYNDALGDERPRVYDNRVLFSVEGGWKPSPEWEFSLRWIYAGGAPYTPMDVAASQDARQEVLDAGRINAARHPDYHSMNVRVDRRFNFTGSSLVIYLSVWNVYDRKNVAGYIWDDANQRVKTLYQWGLLPIFGVEWEM